MSKIRISDRTLACVGMSSECSLSFREKIEVCKLLDKLNLDLIELEEIKNPKIDSLLIKSVAIAVKNSTLVVPVPLMGDIEGIASYLKEAKSFRLQVVAPVSSVRMEYVYHKKPAALTEAVVNTIKICKEYTDDVEFFAEDASRGDSAFLYSLIKEAINAGATTVTVSDDAGAYLPSQCAEFVEDIFENVPELNNISLGVNCSNDLSMADACAIASVSKGALEIKTSSALSSISSLSNIVKILSNKGDAFNATTDVDNTIIKRTVARIERFVYGDSSRKNAFEVALDNTTEEVFLSKHDDKKAVISIVSKLGYDISEEDEDKVYDAFLSIAKKKEKVSGKELDSIVASVAMQVPSTYVLDSYIVNTGSDITSMVHVKLNCKDEIKEGISLGDGPIDAAFLAIESITGRHFELDDFQIRAITEGKEAAGETVVKLRYEGKTYSGRGSSTDIIGSSIQAYVNALNKLVYEEEEA